LDGPQFVFTPRLKPTGVMKNVAFVICEDEFIFDVVLATLRGESS
jgi:hypothetical protein